MGMDHYLLIPFLGGWTSIYQLFWCSPGVQGFDTLPYIYIYKYISLHGYFPWWSCLEPEKILRRAITLPWSCEKRASAPRSWNKVCEKWKTRGKWWKMWISPIWKMMEHVDFTYEKWWNMWISPMKNDEECGFHWKQMVRYHVIFGHLLENHLNISSTTIHMVL